MRIFSNGRKYRILLFLIMLLAATFFSCELWLKQEPGKMYIISVGISYGSLHCTFADSKEMGSCLEALCKAQGRPFEAYYFNDGDQTKDPLPTRLNIQDKIEYVSRQAGKNDTLVVFISSHGFSTEDQPRKIPYGYSNDYRNQAFIVTTDLNGTEGNRSNWWKCSDFCETVRQFPGKKCVIADFCFSGSLITENNVTSDSRIYSDRSNKVDLFLDLLFNGSKVEQESDFYILAASKPYEKSYTDGSLSLFTEAVLAALGWDHENLRLRASVPACKAGEVTLQNIADEARKAMKSSDHPKKSYQHMKITGSAEDLVLFKFR